MMILRQLRGKGKQKLREAGEFLLLQEVPGQATKRLTGKGGKLNTSQAEPVAAKSRDAGQVVFPVRRLFY